MKKDKPPNLFSVKCPKCGSRNTKVDWTRADNYRRLILASVVAIAGTFPGGWDRVCLDCQQRFEP